MSCANSGLLSRTAWRPISADTPSIRTDRIGGQTQEHSAGAKSSETRPCLDVGRSFRTKAAVPFRKAGDVDQIKHWNLGFQIQSEKERDSDVYGGDLHAKRIKSCPIFHEVCSPLLRNARAHIALVQLDTSLRKTNIQPCRCRGVRTHHTPCNTWSEIDISESLDRL
jgi:hypothetical protein